MRDIKLTRSCDHRIVDEVLTIDGVSPNYIANLRFESNGNKSNIVIRELYETDGMTNFNPYVDGITDFVISEYQTLVFNQNLGSQGINYLEGAKGLYPEKTYVATYIAKYTDCPKCLSSNQLTDFSFDSVGGLNLVELTEYLKQRVVKALITVKGSNSLAPSYGSNLASTVGRPNLAFIMLNIQQSILETVNRLMEVQSSYIDSLKDEEILVGVENIVIMPTNDPRELTVSFILLSSNFEETKISFSMKV